jgi:hypothetical protein
MIVPYTDSTVIVESPTILYKTILPMHAVTLDRFTCGRFGSDEEDLV